MFSHIHIGTHDLASAVEFFDRVLEPLGITRKFIDYDREWAGWRYSGAERPLFLVGKPFNQESPVSGNGPMVAFNATDRNLVERCYRLAIVAGGTDEGTPRLRPEYHESYFGAYFRDLDGNKICICCHEPV